MRFGLIATPASQAAFCCASNARFEARYTRHMLLGAAREIVIAVPPREGRGGGAVADVTDCRGCQKCIGDEATLYKEQHIYRCSGCGGCFGVYVPRRREGSSPTAQRHPIIYPSPCGGSSRRVYPLPSATKPKLPLYFRGYSVADARPGAATHP